MADHAQPRRLATIVALDVAGYSARTETDVSNLERAERFVADQRAA